MPLTLSTLLNCTDLGLTLVAGERGLDTRGTVRWIHSSELPDPTRWLQGGEILLTTGFGIRHSARAQRSLMKKLDGSGCVGVGIGLGDWLKSVPKPMLAEAEARGLPIFLVPYTVPFAVVTKRVAELIFREQDRSLQDGADLHRQLLAIVLSGKTPQAVIELMLPPTKGYGCILFDFYGNVLAETGTVGMAATEVWPAVRPQWRRDRSQVEFAERHFTASAIRLDQDVEGMLIFSSASEPNANEAMLFEQILAAVQLSLARTQSARGTRRGVVGELIEEVTGGTLPARTVEKRLTRLGFTAEASFTVLCMPLPSHVTESMLCSLIEDLIADQGATPAIGGFQGHVFVLTENGDVAEAIAEMARKRGWRNFTIGRSMRRTAPGELGISIREAHIAAQAGRSGGIVDVSGIGLRGLLPRIAGDGWTQIYVDQILGPLLREQEDERSSLIETLRQFLRHNCRPGPAAAALGVHRHTLAYRLDRIAALSGRDPRHGRDLLELGLALEFRDALDAEAGRF